MKFVFVSYAPDDAQLARAIVNRLKSALAPSGVEIRFDEDEAPRRLFPEWVDENIVAADRVLVLWSAAARDDAFVLKEAEKARALGKYVACLIDPELNPVEELPPPFNVYLTPLVVMPDLAAQASTLSLDDEEFNKLAEELAKPPTVPSAEPVEIGAVATAEEAAEREDEIASIDPWSVPGGTNDDAVGDRLRALFVEGLDRLLASDDADVKEAAAKYLETEVSAQDDALSALNTAAARINSTALWNDVGAVSFPRRPSDAVVAWRRAGLTDAEICGRLGLPLAALGAAAVAAQAARIIGGPAEEPPATAEAAAEPEIVEAEVVEPEAAEEPAAPEPEPVAVAPAEPGDKPAAEADDAEDEEEDDEDEDQEEEASEEEAEAEDESDDDEEEDEEEDRRERGGAGAFFAGALTLLLLLAGAGGAALYFLKVEGQPLYAWLDGRLRAAPEAAVTAATPAATQPAAAPQPACLDPESFNGATLDEQRAALARCDMQLAALPEPPQPPAPTLPAWCTNAAAFQALTAAQGDVTEELAACGVTLPAAAPAPEAEVRVETRVETVTCPDPATFNGLAFAAQREALTACGLTLAESPVQVASAAPGAAATPSAARPTTPPAAGDGSQACSETVGPPCRVTLDSPQSLGMLAQMFYGEPLAWCWIYETNREVFDSESRPALVRGDPNCVYAGDSYQLDALPEGWRYSRDCSSGELLSNMCPRSLGGGSSISSAPDASR
jgi:hypothetical protein